MSIILTDGARNNLDLRQDMEIIMPTPNMEEALREIPLLAGLDPAQRAPLAAAAQVRELPKGSVLFSEGEPAHALFLVSQGRIRVYKLSPEGREQTLHLFGPGEPVGEAPVFTGGNFPAHARATQASRVLCIPRTAFVSALARDPAIAMNLLAVLSRRLMRFAALIEDLSLREAPARLAAFLLHSAAGSGRMQLDMTKAHLATMLGTTPETLSRILSRMQQEDMVAVSGRDIELVDPSRLERIAEGSEKLDS